MSLFHEWKTLRQMPEAPHLDPRNEVELRAAFFAGGQAALNELKSVWPNEVSEHPLADLAAKVTALEKEIYEALQKALKQTQ